MGRSQCLFHAGAVCPCPSQAISQVTEKKEEDQKVRTCALVLSIGFVELEFSKKGELKNMRIQMKNKQEKGFKQLPQKKIYFIILLENASTWDF